MPSNAARGAYFKARTKKWLIARGWQVADMEIVRWIYQPGGKPIPVKRDQFGSDLLAMRGSCLMFLQVKGGEQARGNGAFPAAFREFGKFTFPETTEQLVVAWAPRARAPRFIDRQLSKREREFRT